MYVNSNLKFVIFNTILCFYLFCNSNANFIHRGATHSNLVICDETGKVVGQAKGPGTNHWALGIEKCAARVIAMLHAAKQDAGLPLDMPLDSLVSRLCSHRVEGTEAEFTSYPTDRMFALFFCKLCN